jgi:hypothetical protein
VGLLSGGEGLMRIFNFIPRPKVAKQWLRAKYAVRLAESLYQAEKCSTHAKLDDLNVVEQQRYHRIAEHAISLLETDL